MLCFLDFYKESVNPKRKLGIKSQQEDKEIPTYYRMPPQHTDSVRPCLPQSPKATQFLQLQPDLSINPKLHLQPTIISDSLSDEYSPPAGILQGSV